MCQEDYTMSIAQKPHPRFLILMPMGIGDAVIIGLSAIDQIIKNEPAVYGNIDIVCNNVQADIFRLDPRIDRIIDVDSSIFATPDVRTWVRGIILKPEAIKLIHFLRSRHYTAAFPGNTTPIFYRKLNTSIMRISIFGLLKIFFSLRHQADIPISNITQQIVNAHFGNKVAAAIDEEIPLYISSQHLQQARGTIAGLQEQSGIGGADCRLLLVAADTTSVVTRPPPNLLAKGIADALMRRPHLIAAILPAYTDSNAAASLYQALAPNFERRVFMLPQAPRLKLLETTALLDQADIVITGDTGVMHLAVTTRKFREDDNARLLPRNVVNTIALFGGTNPGLHGYSKRTTILGRGRKEQTMVAPGIFKEAYYGKQRDFFDHIAPQQLTEAIFSHLEGGQEEREPDHLYP
jgi:hypothetical protein